MQYKAATSDLTRQLSVGHYNKHFEPSPEDVLPKVCSMQSDVFDTCTIVPGDCEFFCGDSLFATISSGFLYMKVGLLGV